MNASQYLCSLHATALLLGSIIAASAADQTATWNSTTGNWSEATKWSTNPTFPNNGVNTFDVIQNGGTLTVNQAITIEKYNLTGGTNTGAGLTLTLNDLLTWTGGTLDGSGLISADGGANLSGASTKFLNGTRQLNLSGTSTWSGGNITQQSSSTLRNLAGGVFTTSHDGNLAGGFMNNLGTFTKSAGGGTTTVSSVFYNSGGTVNANSGILNFTGGGVHTGTFSAGTGATLQFGGGTHDLNAGASLTGAGTISVTGGTVSANAAVSSGASTTFSLAGGTFSGTGTLTVNGPMTWSGGTLLGTSTLNSTANTTWSAGQINAGAGAVFNNSGTFTTTFDGTFNPIGGTAPNFNNSGTFIKSGGAGTTTFGNGGYGPANFNNTGTVQVNSGTLALNGNGTHTNSLFSIAAGATLSLSGTQTFSSASTSTIDGAGLALVAGTMSVSGGGTVNVSAPLRLAGTLNGTGTVHSTTSTNWTSGTLTGAGTLNVSGVMTINGGPRELSGGWVINSTADTTWSAGQINASGGAVFNNNGTFNTNFDGTYHPIGGPSSQFNNTGTFIKSGGTGTTTFNSTGHGPTIFNNTGTVQVNSGTLALNGGGTHTNSLFSIAAGSTLSLSGTHTFSSASTSTIDGAGLAVVAGTVSVNGGGTVNASAPLRLAGTLNGTGTVNSTTSTNWTTGTLTGAGTLNVSGLMTINGGNRELSGGRVINSTAETTWSAGQISAGGGAVFNNNGTFTTNFDGSFVKTNIGGADPQFNNTGTFIKSGATGTTSFTAAGYGPTIFNNTGTVQVNSGTLSLNDTLTQHSGSTITGGTWNVTNGASISRTTGSNITTIGSAASVMLDGAGSSFAKVTTALNNNQGSFTLKNNRDLTTAGALTNSGTLRVEDSTTVMTIGTGGASAYTQTAGSTVLVGGALIDASVFNLNGGELKGTGIIDSSVVTGGTNVIAPGQSPGTLTINGSLTLSSGSTLAMEIGGLTQGTLYDYLDVNGTLTLAGLLNLSFLNDFQNSLGMGSLFTLATSDAAVLGGFGNVANGGFLTDMASLHTFSVHYGAGSLYNPNDVVLYAVTPEPGRALLLILGLLGLTLQRKRHACAVDSAAL